MSTAVSGEALDGPYHGEVFLGEADTVVPAYRTGVHVGDYTWDAEHEVWRYTERELGITSTAVERE